MSEHDTNLTLQSGQEIAKGFVPMTRAELAKGFYVFQQQGKFFALPPPPATIINSAGVIFDPYGNSNFASSDTSYKGWPVGDCTMASITTMVVAMSQCTNLPSGQLNFLASTVVAYWRKYNSMCSIQNGLNMLAKYPLVDASGKGWTLGPNGLIDWTKLDEVRQGLYLFKAINNGVNSSPLDAACQGQDGYVVTGITRPINNGKQLDHATTTLDVGEAGALFDARKLKLPTNKISATTIAASMPSWGVWGCVEFESYVNMTGEAHVAITSTARGDAATWNPVAEADFADLANPWGPLVDPPPPGPGPVPPFPVPNPSIT